MFKKKVLPAIAAALVLLLAVLLVRTFTPAGDQSVGEAFEFRPDSDRVTRLMSESVRFETISFGRDKPTSTKKLLAYHDYLEKEFPLVHKTLKREVIADYSLLYTWQGSNRRATTISRSFCWAILMLCLSCRARKINGSTHRLKVLWLTALFGGAARSTIRSILSVCWRRPKTCCSKACSPSARFIFAFGHDEEQGGIDGAKVMADVLLKRGVQAEFLVDEGGLGDARRGARH